MHIFLNYKYIRFVLLGLILIAAVCIGFTGSAHASTFNVTTTADSVDSNPGNGTCADASSQCSVRAALMEANALAGDDDINIPSGTYTLTLGQQLEIKDGVKLLGPSNDPTTTIIQAASSAAAATHRVLEINPALNSAGYNVTINGLTIRHGKAPVIEGFGGGGIGGDVGDKTLVISHSIIEKNIASGEGYGGGLFVSGSAAGRVQLTDVVINNNTAGDITSTSYGSRGGGIYLEGDMSLAMSNLTVNNNISYGLGGGMAIVSASPSLRTVTLSSSTITGNAANSKSGGVEGRAGGLYLGTSAVITNTDISNNTAGGDGGGLVLDFFVGSVSLTDVNVTNNTAVRGGGIFINANKAPSLTNTSISGNTVGDVAVNPEGTDMKVTIAPKVGSGGTFSQGKIGAHYSVTVRNNGNVHTNGMVTATVTLPAELTATSLVGTGWTCTLGTLTCTRSDVLNGQSDYPVIDVAVNVTADAQRSVTSTAKVSGGDELDVSNNTGSHVTTILSRDATLSGLAITPSTLKETFASGKIAYTADVLYAINSITATPTVNESHATVKVNNTNVISGQPSGSLGLTVGNNNIITVLVTAEDGITQKTYTITVTRLPKSTNANLSDLKVDGTSIAGFASSTLAYTVNVPNATTAVVAAGTKADATASVVVSGGNNLAVGNNTVTVKVTAEDGTTVITYTVTVVRAASSNASLSDLKVDGMSIAGFASGTLSYTVNVPNATTAVVVAGTKADATASAIVSGGTNLTVGNNTVTVAVTAQDGTTVLTYTVTVVRAASSNASLSDLKVDGTSIVGFASGTLAYTLNVPNTTTSVVVAGTKADATASVVVSGGSNLAVGNNTVTLTVTAEDGTTVVAYTMTVVRAASNNASLSDLKVDGTSVAGFTSGTLAYTVNVPNATTAVVVAGTMADATARVVVSGGNNLAVGNNTVTVTVTAEDGTTVIPYTVSIIRAASSNAGLSDLKVDGTSIAGFVSGTLAYSVNVPNATTAVVVAGTKADETASVVVSGGNNLTVGNNNTVTLTVTAQDGTTVITYTVTVVRAASSNASLSDLKVDGTSIAGFASGTLAYTVNVPNETTAVVVEGTKADETASVVVSGGNNLTVGNNNTVTLTVTAQDGTTVITYTVTVVRAASSNASLSDLKVDGTSIAGFASGTLAYTVNVPNETTAVVVEGTKADETASVVVFGGNNLTVGNNNTVTVTVMAQDGTVITYTVTVVKAASSNASLSDLKIDGTTVTGFVYGTFDYIVNVSKTTTSVIVTGTKADLTASLNVSGGSNLNFGNNTVTIEVTAEDTTTVKTYTVTVIRQSLSTNANLSDLKVNDISVTGFVYGTLDYRMNVPNETTSVSVTATVEDSTASVTVFGGSNLIVGNNTVTVTVTAEKATEQKTYTVTIVRAPSSNKSLSDLLVDGTNVAGFAPGTFTYTINVANATTSVIVTATKADATASVTVTGGNNLTVGNNNTVTVKVTAQDGTEQTYTVTVVRAGSGNASLSDLLVEGTSVAGFAPSIFFYSVNVPYTTTSVAVTATKADATANVTVTGGSNLIVGDNMVTVTVTSQDTLSSQVYTLNVIRAPGSSNVSLSDLLVDEKSIVGFVPGILNYTVNVTSAVYSVTVTGNVYDPTSSLEINNTSFLSGQPKTIQLQKGINAITVKVIAQNLKEQKNYTINIQSNAELKSLTASGVILSPPFILGTSTYNGTVPYEVSSTTVTASVYDPKATFTINGVVVRSGVPSSPFNLAVGLNTIKVVVTPEYGVTQIYTILVTRLAQESNDSGSGSPSAPSPVQINLNVGDKGTMIPLELQRERTPNGRVIDKVVIPSNIVKQFTEGAPGSDQKTLRLVIPQLPEGGDEFNVNIPRNTLQALGENDLALSIETDQVQLTLPKETVAKAFESKEDLYVGFVPIRTDIVNQETEKRVLNAQIVTKAAGSGKVVLLGLPMTIETNLKDKETKLNFSFKGIKIPSDLKERNEFLSSLGIYIEHSDGEKELVKGIIKYDSKGNPVGIEIVITKFSTFSMIQIQKKVIDTISYKSWIEGYPDGTFKPNQSITRSETASIFVKALTLIKQQNGLLKFKDVADNHWAADAIRQVQDAGLLSGYPDGSFKPDAPITRAELATIIVRINKLNLVDKVQSFTDTQGHWAAGYIQATKVAGLMSGYEDGSFKPDQRLTRAEAVKVINTLLKRPTPKLDKNNWTDVTKLDWFWLDVQSASESFSNTRYEDGTSNSVVIP